MNRRALHLDLLHSGKYRRQVVKAKKGKGAYTRHDKHKKTRSDQNGFFAFIAVQPKGWLTRPAHLGGVLG